MAGATVVENHGTPMFIKMRSAILGGSCVVISGVISRVTSHIRGLITLLITTHEPPSRAKQHQHSVEPCASFGKYGAQNSRIRSIRTPQQQDVRDAQHKATPCQ